MFGVTTASLMVELRSVSLIIVPSGTIPCSWLIGGAAECVCSESNDELSPREEKVVV